MTLDLLSIQQTSTRSFKDSSFFKVCDRQFSIFDNFEEKADYFNYIVNYTLDGLQLNFLKKIAYHETKQVKYEINKSRLIIPIETLKDSNCLKLLPLIVSIIEYKNIHNFNKKENNALFNSIVNKNSKKIFKINYDLINENKYDTSCIYHDYFLDNAIKYILSFKNQTPFSLIENPNLDLFYKTNDLVIVKKGRHCLVFNNIK